MKMSGNVCLILDVSGLVEWTPFTSKEPSAKLLPAGRAPTVLQADRATAEKEVERLALRHPDGRFVVFEGVSAACAVDIPTGLYPDGNVSHATRECRIVPLVVDDGVPF
jgi:hypothetical protein